MASGQSVNITKTVPTSFVDTEDDHNVVKPPQPSLGWTKDSDAVLLSDGWDIWKVPAAAGAAVNLTVNGKKDGIRYRSVLRLDPGREGHRPVEAALHRDVRRVDEEGRHRAPRPGQAGRQLLLWDDASFAAAEGEEGRRLPLHEVHADGAADYYVTDASLKAGQEDHRRSTSR